MATISASQVDGQVVLLPNYEPWTTVAVTNSLTTNVTTVAKRRISFEYAEYDINVTFTGVNTQGLMSISLPSGDVMDFSVLAVASTFESLDPILSSVNVFDATGVSRYLGRVFMNTTTNLRINITDTSVTAFGASNYAFSNTLDTSINRPITFAVGDQVTIRFQVPLTRLAGGYTAVGAGFATGSRPGLVQQTPQTALTVTGTGWTTVRAVGVAYADVNGVWRMRFNIYGTVTSSSRTTYIASISGTVFKATISQIVAGGMDGGTPSAAFDCLQSSGNVRVNHATTTTTGYYWSGDVELDAKPSWA